MRRPRRRAEKKKTMKSKAGEERARLSQRVPCLEGGGREGGFAPKRQTLNTKESVHRPEKQCSDGPQKDEPFPHHAPALMW